MVREFFWDEPEFAGNGERGLRADEVNGTQFDGDDYVAHHGAWPGGCETDYDVWCDWCHAFLWHGLGCPEDCQAETITVQKGPR
jgi:hypothetical protein